MSVIIKLPEYVNKIMTDLESKGFEVFAVGGAVRDCLLKKEPDDWDLCTSATPDEMINALKNYTTIPTGLKHGTISVKSDNHFIEVTTYRSDGEYSDCRHPNNIKFVKCIEEDLKRRDFTINAFAYNQKDDIIDLFNGRRDLENKMIRCVGIPNKRFKEDALRIIRALRFAAVLDFNIESKTEQALFENINLLNEVSAERILAELKKIILSGNSDVIQKYKSIFEYILGVTLIDEDISMISQLPKDISMGFAALFYSVDPMQTAKIFKHLKMDNKSIAEIKMYLSLKGQCSYLKKSECKRFINRYGADMVNKCIDFLSVAYKNNSKEWEETRKIINSIIENKECCYVNELDISGTDIKNLGYGGRDIGDILNFLLNAVIEEEVINSKEELINYIKQHKICKM